jgi:AhpD family alkylhydroperoxidase
MSPRIDYAKVAPGAVRAMFGLEKYLDECGLEPSLRELVKVRASQINGCAYCIDMHTKDARASGESEQRLYALSAWRETPFFTDRERAALAWTASIVVENLLPLLQVGLSLRMWPFSAPQARVAVASLLLFGGMGLAGRLVVGDRIPLTLVKSDGDGLGAAALVQAVAVRSGQDSGGRDRRPPSILRFTCSGVAGPTTQPARLGLLCGCR